MAVQVRCPACGARVEVRNAKYLVVLNCHACGREFLADAEELSAGQVPPAKPEPEQAWSEDEESSEDDEWSLPKARPAVLMFCPMCGELAPESTPTCPACGEPLPVDGPGNEHGGNLATREARQFRRQTRLLGVLWIVLAYTLMEHDFWIGGTELGLPPMLSPKTLAIPPLPITATILICLAAFALVGQFWAVAAGALFNYSVLFLVVWQANVESLGLLIVSIVFTHYVLHQASSARFR